MNNCDLCNPHGKCEKYRHNRKCVPSTDEWLYEEYPNRREYISVNQMCRAGSIFGNDYIGLTEDDISKLRDGEIIHVPGEYGIFIGIIKETDNEKRSN